MANQYYPLLEEDNKKPVVLDEFKVRHYLKVTEEELNQKVEPHVSEQESKLSSFHNQYPKLKIANAYLLSDTDILTPGEQSTPERFSKSMIGVMQSQEDPIARNKQMPAVQEVMKSQKHTAQKRIRNPLDSLSEFENTINGKKSIRALIESQRQSKENMMMNELDDEAILIRTPNQVCSSIQDLASS